MKFTQLSEEDIKKMLEVIGISSIEEMFTDIPKRDFTYNYIPEKGMTEIELRNYFKTLAKKNKSHEFSSFIGGGFYKHYIPSIVFTILSRSEFYTAYTPYQPEVSQGSLQMIFEFQSMISEITGLPISNASMYDGATAFAEALLMSFRLHRGKRKKFFYAKTINPIYKNVLLTYMQFHPEFELKEVPEKDGLMDLEYLKNNIDEETAGVACQYPNFYGQIEDYDTFVNIVHEKKAFAINAFYPIAASILKRPGDYDFDIVVGNGQSLGNPMYFSGPTFGFFSTKKEYVRQMPGRLISETVDSEGKRGFVMTLQTREQHIRRERATSNICSNQTLNTLAAAVYLSYVGKKGFRELGERIAQLTAYAIDTFEKEGIKIKYDKDRIFNEFVVETDKAGEIIQKAIEEKILAGIDLSKFEMGNGLLIAITELNTPKDIETLAKIIKE